MKPLAASTALVALTFAAFGVAASLGACGGGVGGSTGSTGTGGGTSSSSASSSSSSGDGGGGGQPATTCTTLCDHVAAISCQAWTTCPADCADKLGSPAECAGAFDALITCWSKNLMNFACTALQILPPSACKAEEEAFYQCVAPDMVDTSCICSAGVGSSGQDKCARKTACGMSEYAAVCQVGMNGDWDCSCYDKETLLGTCTEAADLMPHCDNMIGCCTAYFCAPK
jgi:hypothetical protein